MGNVMSRELASMPRLSMEEQIAIMLRCNHYPPVPLSMVEPCIDAINACNAGVEDDAIALPDGVVWRGRVSAPAWVIVDSFHLGEWLTV